MSKNLRNPDIPIDESCVFDKSPPLTFNELIKHLIWLNKLKCCGKKIYIYDEVLGYYKLLKGNEFWFCIHKFFSEKVKEFITPIIIRRLEEALHYVVDIYCDTDGFDRHENLINVINGVLNVDTGELYHKSYKYGFTSFINAKYIPDATIHQCPTFKKFVETSLCNDAKSLILILQCIGVLCSNYSSIKKQLCS